MENKYDTPEIEELRVGLPQLNLLNGIINNINNGNKKRKSLWT